MRDPSKTFFSPLLLTLLVASIALLLASWPRAAGQFVALPGNPAAELLFQGEQPSPAAFDRFLRSRARALRQLDSPDWHIDIGAARLSQALLAAEAGQEPREFLREAREALREGLARKPGESTGWLWLAMTEAQVENWPAMITALRLSLLTTPFDPPNMVTRSSLGLLAWSQLDPVTRPLVFQELSRTMARYPQELIMAADGLSRRRELQAALAADSALVTRLGQMERRMRGQP